MSYVRLFIPLIPRQLWDALDPSLEAIQKVRYFKNMAQICDRCSSELSLVHPSGARGKKLRPSVLCDMSLIAERDLEQG